MANKRVTSCHRNAY